MNIDDAMRRFQDPSEWKLRFEAPGYVAPAHNPRAPLRFAVATACVAVGVTVLAAVGVALVDSPDPVPPVALPSSSPAPPAIVQTVIPDDGRVATSQYRTASNFGHESAAVQGDNDSVPWVVLHADNDESGLVIAYVAGGSSCGDHLGVEVIETTKSVTITAVNSPLAPGLAEACRQAPSVEGGEFSLDEPLGTRTLLHSALSAPWTAEDQPIDTEPGEDRVPPAIPDPREPAYDGSATCQNLLSDSTRSTFERKGWSEAGKSYSDKIWEEGQGDSLFSAFIDNGGILCAYGDETLVQVLYGYGPITAEQAAIQLANLKRGGFELADTGQLDVYTVDDPDAFGAVAFGDGVWAFSWDLGGSTHLIDDVLENRPQAH